MFLKSARTGRKGQIGAPIELMVAVIIMAVVIIISSQVLFSTNMQVCKSNVEKSVYEFKSLLEDTIKRKGSNAFIYFPENPCFDLTKATTTVQKLYNKAECQLNCGAPLDSCWVLQFDSKETRTESIFVKTCLDIPAYTKFTASDTECASTLRGASEGYTLADATQKLPFGQYLLISNPASDGTDAAPTICTLYKSVTAQ